jgi:hypothetical protein
MVGLFLSASSPETGVCASFRIKHLSATLLLGVIICGCSLFQGDNITDSPMGEPTVLDTDGDGVVDALDNCPEVQNKDQSDLDGNDWGDVCDDMDGDGIIDARDRWPFDPNNDVDKDNRGADPYGICKRACETCKN